MLIGEVARRSGIAASALRYYEREGLLPAPERVSKRRTYSSAIIGRLRIIQVARDAGFSIADTRAFLGNFPNDSAPSGRWQKLAERKLQEIDELIVRANQMKAILRSSFKCGCKTIADCERLIIKIDLPRCGEAGVAVPFLEEAAKDGAYPEAAAVLQQIQSKETIEPCRCRRHINKDLREHANCAVHPRQRAH